MSEATSKQRLALVTGASRGIGQAIAQQLADDDYWVVGTATSAEGAERIAEGLGHDRGCGRVLDVKDVASIDALIKDIQATRGGVDVLVNNAGITDDQLMMRMSDAAWDAVIQTNLTGPFYLMRACLRGMMKQRWGRMITIASVVGHMGNPGQVNYCASKAGVVGMSKALAREVAPRGVTVNVVSPGFIATDMTASLLDTQKEHILNGIPMQAMGEPSHIASAVSYLASDGAGYTTGETIHVNGGMLMS